MYIYLEPQRPLFLKANPSKQGPFQACPMVIWVLYQKHGTSTVSGKSPSASQDRPSFRTGIDAWSSREA